ncbi:MULTISPECIES: RidA family protein [unclassified Microbacterium]|uniref:RidA family protein n=1 Tax=unclassified Microbacterium TaxID=2609290 RepID=UPI003466DA7A
MNRKNINASPPRESQLYSDAVTANGVVYTTGQMPVDDEWNLLSDDFEVQARFVFERLRRVLDAAGSSPGHILRLTIFLTDIDDVASLSDLRREFLGDNRPASVIVQVPRFGTPGMRIEAEAVALVR